jgi:hypothetical protein
LRLQAAVIASAAKWREEKNGGMLKKDDFRAAVELTQGNSRRSDGGKPGKRPRANENQRFIDSKN